MQTTRILDILAWIGTGCALIGYGLFSTGIVSNALVYHILNLIASITIGAISYRRKVWQPFLLNAVFGILAAIAILRMVVFS